MLSTTSIIYILLHPRRRIIDVSWSILSWCTGAIAAWCIPCVILTWCIPIVILTWWYISNAILAWCVSCVIMTWCISDAAVAWCIPCVIMTCGIAIAILTICIVVAALIIMANRVVYWQGWSFSVWFMSPHLQKECFLIKLTSSGQWTFVATTMVFLSTCKTSPEPHWIFAQIIFLTIVRVLQTGISA